MAAKDLRCDFMLVGLFGGVELMDRPALDVQEGAMVTAGCLIATMNFDRLTALARETVAATQRRLPATVRGPALAVPVEFAALPDEALVEEGFEPDILGLFTGPAYGDDRGGDSLLPPHIFLYLDNLWDYAEGDVAVFQEEVRLTYLHELGHYLGWNEDDLSARGLD
jgi:predicted Zn-dependent protease with MMP-like domain